MPQRIALIAHDATQSAVVQELQAHVTLTRPDVLSLRYSLWGDMSRIRVAAAVAGTELPGRTDGLWKHTCFEAFIRPDPSQDEYYELNFSAAKQWAAYRFTAYRAGMAPLELPGAPEISVRQTLQNLELEVAVKLPFELSRPAIAVAAVVEEDSGRLCYWSARHPPGKPDFHHADGYVIEL
jgi:hypothetical protein